MDASTLANKSTRDPSPHGTRQPCCTSKAQRPTVFSTTVFPPALGPCVFVVVGREEACTSEGLHRASITKGFSKRQAHAVPAARRGKGGRYEEGGGERLVGAAPK